MSFIGQPGTYLTMWMLGELIQNSNYGLGIALKINTFVGAYTGLLFHAIACIQPLAYRTVHDKMSEEEAEKVIEVIGKYPAIPSIISALSLFFGTTVIVTAAILTGALQVPGFFVLFNPIVSSAVLLLLKKLGVKIIGTLGAGFSLFAIVLIAAG